MVAGGLPPCPSPLPSMSVESSAVPLRVLHVDLRVHPMRTRFPFRYGIASMSAVPHLFVKAEVEIDGKAVTGLSSEGLPPKWFTKNPQSSMEQDLAEMIAVIQHAVKLSLACNDHARTLMQFWERLRREQGAWAETHRHPPLLWNLGVSLVERAVVDALCKWSSLPLHQLVKTDLLGLDWDTHPRDFLPEAPLSSVQARHTVGLADPIRVSDIPEGERLSDGLPQALEECIPAYGLRYFKIKIGSGIESELPRLITIIETLEYLCKSDWQVTLDGNEFFQDMETFRSYFETLQKTPALRPLLDRTLWVEQPVHRSQALDDSVGKALHDWKDAPTLIIDESDGASGDATRALALGYAGVSHKNCKGILKGLRNALCIHQHRLANAEKNLVISGEDLVNVGPVALLQDLAMQALLGVSHVERNGHHYFRGLSMYPAEIGRVTAQAHPDLYTIGEDGVPKLKIQEGAISLQSVNTAPFGCGAEIDVSIFPTLKEWILGGGMAELTSA